MTKTLPFWPICPHCGGEKSVHQHRTPRLYRLPDVYWECVSCDITFTVTLLSRRSAGNPGAIASGGNPAPAAADRPLGDSVDATPPPYPGLSHAGDHKDPQ